MKQLQKVFSYSQWWSCRSLQTRSLSLHLDISILQNWNLLLEIMCSFDLCEEIVCIKGKHNFYIKGTLKEHPHHLASNPQI